jgi:ArsR family transcriptional regulator, arsenate/arsenite/antimonite-responsive transcriptional repressor
LTRLLLLYYNIYQDIQIYIGEINLKEIVKVFKAIGDETRIRLLKLLQQRELCVCELMQALDMTQSRVSRNLGILKNAGLVEDRRDGLWVHYSLNVEAKPYIKELLEMLKDSCNDDKIIAKDLVELSKAQKLSNICNT